MVFSGVSPPSLENLSLSICPSPILFKPQDSPPPSPSFCRSNKGGRNYAKIPLSSGEEKHVGTYVDMSTTRKKTRTKYSNKELP